MNNSRSAQFFKDAQKVIGDCRDKLAHKEFASGVIYLKMEDYRAATQ